jgi:hypothetical protein
MKNIKEDGIAPAAVNAMGSSSSIAGSGGIDMYDKQLKTNKKKPLRNIIKRKSM